MEPYSPEGAIATIKLFEDDMKAMASPMYRTTPAYQHRFSEGVECILENYRGTFQDTSAYNRTLLAKIEELTRELKEVRNRESAMEKKLLAYNQYHPSGFINRRNFDTYILTTRERIATDEEWTRFTNEFSFNTNPMTLALYSWIDKHIA
jgi:hypothetical protein